MAGQSRSDVIILDGSMGHVLKLRGVQTSVKGLPFEKRFLAVAVANLEAPAMVRQLHAEYIAAGADVITTNNFSVTPWSLAHIARQEALDELTEAAGLLAREAAREAEQSSGRTVRVAGCLPPLRECYKAAAAEVAAGASLGAALEVLQPEYERIAAGLEPHADLLLCETLASVRFYPSGTSHRFAHGTPGVSNRVRGAPVLGC